MQIFLDGKDRRRLTPDSLTWLESQDYTVTLKHPYFNDTSFIISADINNRDSVHIDYYKNPAMLGTLMLDSYPQGASILINDTATGLNTPSAIQNLIPGNYKISYLLANHKTREETILLTSGDIINSFLPLIDFTKWTDYSAENSDLESDNLSCITKDNNGDFWIGSTDWGLYKFDGLNFKHYHRFNSNLSNNHINEIEFTPNDIMLISTAAGFIMVYPENVFGSNANHEWNHWTANEDSDGAILPDNFVTSTAVQSDGCIWIGTQNGLVKTCYIAETGNWGYLNFPNQFYSLPENHISAISAFDDEIWVATKTSGIISIINNDWNTITFSSSGQRTTVYNCITPFAPSSMYAGFTMNSDFANGFALYQGSVWEDIFGGLPDNNVYSIFIDSQNRKWIGTETSIIVFNNWEDKIIYTYENSGLPIIQISGFAEDLNGNILITSKGGGFFVYKN
jgi:ligand-binding sensor domain-containing protein